jgi:hypothetical protein
MNSGIATTVCRAVAAAIVGFAVAGQTGSATQPDERLEFFKWFDTIGFPEVSSGRFLRVTYGSRNFYGFQTSPAGSPFEATPVSLWLGSSNSPGPLKLGGSGPVTAIDFSAWIRESMDQLSKIASVDYANNTIHVPNSLEEVLVLSRACDARGLTAYSIKLFDEAQAYASRFAGPGYGQDAASTCFQSCLGQRNFDKTLEDFSNPGVPRIELLRRLRFIKTTCPEFTKTWFQAKPFMDLAIPTLERMVAEDRDHGAPTAAASTASKVADLIFRLRDLTPCEILKHNSQLRFSPNHRPTGYEVTIPYSEKPRTDCPDAELIKLGYQAVPQLLDALTDVSFIRAYRGDPYMVQRMVFQVRDAALGILNQIAQANFWPIDPRTLVASAMGPLDTPDEFEANWKLAIAHARSWWDTRVRNGARADSKADQHQSTGYLIGRAGSQFYKRLPDTECRT